VLSGLNSRKFSNVALRFCEATREDDVHDAHRL
jgi:hypothetical protein